LDMSEFARFLRSAREQSRISIQDFAHMCGISTVQNIGRIELGKVVNPSFDTMDRILQTICNLDIIKYNDFCLDGYSESLIGTLNRYLDDKIVVDKPIVNELPEDLTDASKLDLEIAFAITGLIKDYPVFRDTLRSLNAKVKANFDAASHVDYADIMNDLTKRENTGFYFNFNGKMNQIVRTRSYTHAYEFMTMIIQAVCDSIGNYADKDDSNLSYSERQARNYRRRRNNKESITPLP